MNEVHDAGIPRCPNCGQAEPVAAVPAVYRAGQQVVPVRVQDDNGFSHVENRTVPTALAAALAPAPPARGVGAGLATACLGVVLGLFGLGALVAGAVLGQVAEVVTVPGQSPSPDCSYEGTMWTCLTGPLAPKPDPVTEVVHHSYVWLSVTGGVLLALAVAVVVAGARHRRRLAREYQERRTRAEQVWSRGWYCARCGTVHFRPAPDVPSGPVQLREFRRIVWTAGGFGDQLAKYPAP